MPPFYINDMLQFKEYLSSLRCNERITIEEWKTKLKGYGERAFFKTVQVLHNDPPWAFRKTV